MRTELSRLLRAPRPSSGPAAARGENGFTLLEVIVASGLIVAAFTMMAVTLSSVIGAGNRVRAKDRAVVVAQQVLDRQRAFECGFAVPDPLPGSPPLDQLHSRCFGAADGSTVTPANAVGDARIDDYRDTDAGGAAATPAGGNAGGRHTVFVRAAFSRGDSAVVEADSAAGRDCAALTASGPPTVIERRVDVTYDDAGTPRTYTLSARDAIPNDAVAAVANSRGGIVLALPAGWSATLPVMAGGEEFEITRTPVDGCAWFPFLPEGEHGIVIDDDAGNRLPRHLYVQPGSTVCEDLDPTDGVRCGP